FRAAFRRSLRPRSRSRLEQATTPRLSAGDLGPFLLPIFPRQAIFSQSSTQGEPAMSTPEKKLQELGITLPTPPKPMAKSNPPVLIANVPCVSGHGPAKLGDPKLQAGKLGAQLNLEQGKECAKLVGVNILATVKATLGSLDKVKRLLKTLGMVNAVPDYKDHP